MSRTFDRICADLGFVFTAHDLRRTFATVAAEMGVNMNFIGAALNHAKSGVTSKYVQLTPAMLTQTLQAVQDALFVEHDCPQTTD
jgi:integrase